MERRGTQNKNIDELVQQVSEITAKFTFEETLQPPSVELEDLDLTNNLALKALYPERLAYYGQLHRQRARGTLTVEDLERAELWFGMMNSLALYVESAEADPGVGVLWAEQVPVMRSLYNFMEQYGLREPRGYVELATGTGKTVIYSEIARILGLRTLVVTPTMGLVDQAEEELSSSPSQKIEIGKIYSDEKTLGADLTITTYASFVKQLKRGDDSLIKPENYDLIILDEAHHALGEETRRMLRHFDHAIQLGFTASADYTTAGVRTNRRELRSILPHVIHEIPTMEAIKKHLLCPIQTGILQTDVDLSSVPITTSHEYDAAMLEQVVNIDERNLAWVAMYLEYFADQKAVAFCAGIQHARDLAALFRAFGVRAASVDSYMSRDSRQEIYDDLELDIKDGGLQVLCNVRIAAEGFDQRKLSLGLNLVPTLSAVLARQRGGRIPRWLKDKVGTIIDGLDKDYRFPPILYPEPVIGGAALMAPDGFEFPSWFQQANGSMFGNSRLITDPAEVTQIVEDLDALNYQTRTMAPESWKSVAEIADEHNLPEQAVRNTIALIAHDEGNWFHDNSGRHIRRTGSGTAMFYAPPIRDRILDNIEVPEVAPVSWRTVQQLAAIYGITDSRARSVLRGLAATHSHDYGFYAPAIGKLHTRLHYGDDIQQLLASELGAQYIDGDAPSYWYDQVEIRELYGPRAAKSVLENVLRAKPSLRNNHVMRFKNPQTGRTELFYSPEVVRVVASQFKPPKSWHSRADLARALGISTHRVSFLAKKTESYYSRMIEHRQWAPGSRLAGAVYYSPAMAGEISELASKYGYIGNEKKPTKDKPPNSNKKAKRSKNGNPMVSDDNSNGHSANLVAVEYIVRPKSGSFSLIDALRRANKAASR